MNVADSGDFELFKSLCALGANINATDSDGLTVLMCAACQGHDKIVKY